MRTVAAVAVTWGGGVPSVDRMTGITLPQSNGLLCNALLEYATILPPENEVRLSTGEWGGGVRVDDIKCIMG